MLLSSASENTKNICLQCARFGHGLHRADGRHRFRSDLTTTDHELRPKLDRRTILARRVKCNFRRRISVILNQLNCIIRFRFSTHMKVGPPPLMSSGRHTTARDMDLSRYPNSYPGYEGHLQRTIVICVASLSWFSLWLFVLLPSERCTANHTWWGLRPRASD